MTWRGEALWKQAAGPGAYSRHGGELVDMGDVQEFAELDDAKAWRAGILATHPDATVSIEDHRGRRANPGPTAVAAPSGALERVRAARDGLVNGA